jgi:dolichol-phosphate mannosyltransferase
VSPKSPKNQTRRANPKAFLVVIPTFNESEGIKTIVTRVLEKSPNAEVLVVDDLSPDGTGDQVRSLMKKSERVHLIVKEKRYGYGEACRTGFEWGLEHGFDVVVTMDADGSHPPETLQSLVEQARRCGGVAVGSRYVPGGRVEGWPWFRHVLSRCANTYARWILGLPVKDATGGFNAWSKEWLEKLELGSIRSRGYAFLVELKYRAKLLGVSLVEVPIVFKERENGQSKMSLAIMIEGAFRVWILRYRGKNALFGGKDVTRSTFNRVA